ncbi:MAG: AEC family transporter [Burkholderiales bacterium]|nr:AEC family transporter [Burkholderiales bacterium]
MLAILNVAAPFFALIACGTIASRLNLLPQNAIPALNTFVLYFALPCMMFRFMLETPFAQIINGRVFAAYMTAGLITFVIFVMTYRFAHMDRAQEAAYPGLAVSWSNWGYMGFALIPAFLGEEALPIIVAGGMADVFVLLSVGLALAGSGGAGAREIFVGSLLRVVRNPMIWAVVAGAAGSAAGLKLPAAPDQLVRLLGSAAVPVALFAIGVSLYRPGVPVLRAEVMLITGGKLLLHPYIVALVAAFMFGLSHLEVQVLVLMAALPVAGSVFLFAERAGSESDSISGSILVSTALAFLSFSALVWAMGVGLDL